MWDCSLERNVCICICIYVFVYVYTKCCVLHTVKCCDQWGLQLRAECQSAFSTRRSKRVKEISFMTVSSTILRILRTKISRCAPSMFTMFIKCQYIQQGKASRSKHIVSSKKYYKSRSLNVKCESIDEIRNKPNKCNWEY